MTVPAFGPITAFRDWLAGLPAAWPMREVSIFRQVGVNVHVLPDRSFPREVLPVIQDELLKALIARCLKPFLLSSAAGRASRCCRTAVVAVAADPVLAATEPFAVPDCAAARAAAITLRLSATARLRRRRRYPLSTDVPISLAGTWRNDRILLTHRRDTDLPPFRPP